MVVALISMQQQHVPPPRTVFVPIVLIARSDNGGTHVFAKIALPYRNMHNSPKNIHVTGLAQKVLF
jgi:hypothetical protein